MAKETQSTQKSAQGVLSVKVDSSIQEQIEKAAQAKGMTKSDYLREIISNAKKENEIPGDAIQKNDTAAINSISDESILVIAEVVSKIIADSIPAPVILSPDREYLRKIAGKELEENTTLTEQEEKYLQSLTESIKADVTETLLLEENSVPIPHGSAIQKRLFEDMFKKRNAVISEKLPSLTRVMQQGIIDAFYADCKSLYNNSLFKATYGIEYSEFLAVVRGE